MAKKAYGLEVWKPSEEIGFETDTGRLFDEWLKIEEIERSSGGPMDHFLHLRLGSEYRQAKVAVEMGIFKVEEFSEFLEGVAGVAGKAEIGWIPKMWFAFLGSELESIDGGDPRQEKVEQLKNVAVRAWRDEIFSVATSPGFFSEVADFIYWTRPADAEDLIKFTRGKIDKYLPKYEDFPEYFGFNDPLNDVGSVPGVAMFLRMAKSLGYGGLVNDLHVYLREALNNVDVARTDGYTVKDLLAYVASCDDLTDEAKMAIAEKVIREIIDWPRDELHYKDTVDDGLSALYAKVNRFDLMLKLFKEARGNLNKGDILVDLIRYGYKHRKLDEVRKLEKEFRRSTGRGNGGRFEWIMNWQISLAAMGEVDLGVFDLPEIIRFSEHRKMGLDLLDKADGLRSDHPIVRNIKKNLKAQLSEFNMGRLSAYDAQQLMSRLGTFKRLFPGVIS